jgi:hypothetical protein
MTRKSKQHASPPRRKRPNANKDKNDESDAESDNEQQAGNNADDSEDSSDERTLQEKQAEEGGQVCKYIILQLCFRFLI